MIFFKWNLLIENVISYQDIIYKVIRWSVFIYLFLADRQKIFFSIWLIVRQTIDNNFPERVAMFANDDNESGVKLIRQIDKTSIKADVKFQGRKSRSYWWDNFFH